MNWNGTTIARNRRDLAPLAALLLTLAAPLFLPDVDATQPRRLNWAATDPWTGTGGFATAYLVFNGDKGGIEWDPLAPSQDPGGPPAPSTAPVGAVMNQAGDVLRAYATSWNPSPTLPPPDVFRSAALSKAVYLNASRHIQLNLTLKTSEPCYTSSSDLQAPIQLDVELTANGRLVAGAVHDVVRAEWHSKDGTGEYVPGYCSLRYQMHPETDVLEVGAILELRVIHVTQGGYFQYGLAGDHRSLLRFPEYAPDERVFRFAPPQTGPASPSRENEPSPADGAVLAAALTGGLVARKPRSTRATAVVALLLIGAWSGCVGSPRENAGTEPSPKTNGKADADVGFQDATGSDLAENGTGALVGEVADDRNEALANVHVSLPGTPRFSDTKRDGTFVFTNLEPKEYLLRFEKDGFETFETSVAVRANQITKLEIRLAPMVEKADDFRWHRHNDFGEKTSRVILDEDLPEDAYGNTFSFPIQWSVPASESIFPGTRLLEVIVTGTPDAQGPFGLIFDWNPDPYDPYVEYLYPRRNGEPFRIATNWEMTDPGHSTQSFWRPFSLYRTERESMPSGLIFGGSRPEDTGPGPTIHVKMILHRGVAPLERGHPDLWQGKNELVIPMRQVLWFTCGYTLYHAQCLYASPTNDTWIPGHPYASEETSLVPFETVRLEVTLTQGNKSAQRFQSDQRNMGYHGANASPCYGVGARDSKKVAPPKENGAMNWTYTIPLSAGEADPPYAKTSNVCISVGPKDPFGYSLDYTSGIDLKLHVVAFRA